MEVASYMGLLDTVHHAVHGLGYVLCIFLIYLLYTVKTLNLTTFLVVPCSCISVTKECYQIEVH